MTDDQIKHMINRFLAWRLPDDFQPDEGVRFDPDGATKLDPRNRRYEPYGTNLLNYNQAKAMVLHMLDGLPGEVEQPMTETLSTGLTAEWCRERAKKHDLSASWHAEDEFAPLEAEQKRIAAALRIAAAVLDDETVEMVARLVYATQCSVMGQEPNWGRSTPELPSGFATEVAVHRAAAQAVLSCLREAQS